LRRGKITKKRTALRTNFRFARRTRDALPAVERFDPADVVGLRETGEQQHYRTDDSRERSGGHGNLLRKLPVIIPKRGALGSLGQ
jgi:hypothetical protein